ncbi:CBS domain-containing protein [bacterium]|nr:CBS domain-containing protein [bacterium]
MEAQISKNGDVKQVIEAAPMEFDEFDDELRSMEELLDSEEITLTDEGLEAPIKSLQLRKAITVKSGTSLRNCIDKMLARQIGCLLVVKDNTLCGIFTERDVLLKIAGSGVELQSNSVDDFMTSGIKALRRSDTLREALALMSKGKYRHVPIVNKANKPVAVVSIKNIIHYIAEFFPQDVLNLPPHPIRVGTKNREGG